MAGRGGGFEEEALPDKLNFGVWLKVLRYAGKHAPLLCLLLFVMLFTTFYDASFVPSMNKGAYDMAEYFTANGSSAFPSITDVDIPVSILGISFTLSFTTYCVLFVVMILLRAVSIFGTFFLTNYIGMLIMVDLRRDSFKKITELSFSYFDKTSSGWLIARMQNDTSTLGETLSWGLINMFWAFLDIIFTIITMFTIDWRLSLLVCASIPIVAIIVPIFENTLLRRHRTARNAYSHYVGWLAESIEGAKTIKTMAIEEKVNREADEITEDIKNKRRRAGRVNAFFSPTLTVISTSVTALLVYLAITFRESWIIEVGTLLLFVGFISSIYDPLRTIAETFSEFIASQAGAEKVMQLLEAEPEIQDTPEVTEKYGDILHPKKENYEGIDGEIAFEHVNFAYNKGPLIIKDMNLTIEKGKSLAIVGETGSGKTTTVNLICRFYEPTEGIIKIDGVNYLDRSLGWLRSNIGYVQQTPFVFDGTYRENILYGRRDASEEDMVKAAKMVGIHDFIMRQSNGYDTYLEDGGGSLSQGQKQLISYARAIIRNPAILILDEATSNVDTATEAELQEATSSLLKGRTSIVIAHRLSTIVNCDRILVMDQGVIVEDGNHKELMAEKGEYYNLYMNQFRDLSIDKQIKEYQQNIKDKGIKI